jgi:iron complex outermembrane recepter protein
MVDIVSEAMSICIAQILQGRGFVMRAKFNLIAATLLVGTMYTPAFAQSETPPAVEDDGGIQDIIVTAQKREENLQDTPISMVALGADALDQKGIGSINDLFTGAIPSLRVIPFVGRASALSIGMRGMVPVDATQVTRDPTVGIYLDGVYLGRVQGLGMELADIERVEVLRGPQGTLFGRNTIGGAISIVSKRPTGKLGADIKVGIGNRGGRNFAAHINLPEAANLSFKIDAVYDARDGWVKNPLTRADVPANYTIGGQPYVFEDINHDFGEVKRYGFRIAGLFKPTDKISFLYAYDWSRDESTGGYWHVNATTQPVTPPLFGSLDAGRASVSRLAAPLIPSTARTSGHSLTAEWEISDDITLRSISGWRTLDGDQWDQDAGGISRWNTTAQGRFSFANLKQSQFSEELQLIGDIGDVKFALGGYYFKETGSDTATVFRTNTFNVASTATSSILRNPATTSNTVGGVANLLQDRAATANVKSKALFAQATWSPSALNNRLHITVGGRYTDDHKDGRLLFLVGAPVTNLNFVFDSSRFDPMATIAYDFSDDINAYVKYGRAYRAGGANTRSAILRTFGEEELTSWEMGLKADFLDRRARVNIAAYTSQLKNAQVDFSNPANTSATETLNVTSGSTSVKGVELDVTLVPVRGLTISMNYVFTEYGQRSVTNPFSNLAELLNISNTPRHAYSVSLDYELGKTAIGNPRLHIDADNVGGYFASSVPSSDATENAREWLINGRLSLSEMPILGDNFEIAAWVKNLTNRTYQQFDVVIPTGNGNNFTSFYNEPRTFGLEMRMRF